MKDEKERKETEKKKAQRKAKKLRAKVFSLSSFKKESKPRGNSMSIGLLGTERKWTKETRRSDGKKEKRDDEWERKGNISSLELIIY